MLALGLAAALGCGGGGGGTAADTSQFVGNWRWDKGTITANCGAAVQPITQDLTGQMLTLASGSAGNQVVATINDTCQITFTVSGKTASATSGQSCKLTVGGMSESLAVTSWTFTATDGTSLTTDMSGTALAGLCTVTGNGTLSKPADAGM